MGDFFYITAVNSREGLTGSRNTYTRDCLDRAGRGIRVSDCQSEPYANFIIACQPTKYYLLPCQAKGLEAQKVWDNHYEIQQN